MTRLASDSELVPWRHQVFIPAIVGVTCQALLVSRYFVIGVALALGENLLHVLRKVFFEQLVCLAVFVAGKDADFVKNAEFTVRRHKDTVCGQSLAVARDARCESLILRCRADCRVLGNDR